MKLYFIKNEKKEFKNKKAHIRNEYFMRIYSRKNIFLEKKTLKDEK